MGLFDDIGHGLKKVGGSGLNVLEKGGKALVDEDAWGKVLTGKGDLSDWANVALDSSMLIPGAGLVGGGARIAARTGAKLAAREGAEALARKETVNALRSPLNRAVREKAGGAVGEAKGLLTGAKDTALRSAGRNPAARTAARSERGAVGRIAAKQDAKVGTKVGFGQTKRRVLANAALTGGANLAQDAYDNVLPGLLGPDGKKPAGPSGPGAGTGAPGGPGFYFMLGDGSSAPVPSAYFNDPAGFMAQNGIARGTQIQYVE